MLALGNVSWYYPKEHIRISVSMATRLAVKMYFHKEHLYPMNLKNFHLYNSFLAMVTAFSWQQVNE